MGHDLRDGYHERLHLRRLLRLKCRDARRRAGALRADLGYVSYVTYDNHANAAQASSLLLVQLMLRRFVLRICVDI